MREGWKKEHLGEVCERITDGSHNPPKGVLHSDFVMISSQNVFDDSVSYDDVRYLEENDFENEDKRTHVRAGDVLLTIVGTIGRAAVFSTNRKIALQRSVAVLRPKKDILSRFLMYNLIGKRRELNKEAHGVAQKGIYLKQLSKVSIFTPPLPEQERIVAELDLLSGIIDKYKQQLKELDTLAHSIFYDMFGDPEKNEKGWDTTTLGKISTILDSKRKPITKKDRKDGVYPYYGATGIQDYVEGYIFDGRYLLLGEDGAKWNAGDKSAYIIEGKSWVNNHAHILSIGMSAVDTFVLYHLNICDLSKYITGAVVPKLTQSAMVSIGIMSPPLALQQSFAEKIEAIEKQKESVKQAIKETETLFNSRMDYYFN